jgi:hypothetical protein
MAERHVLEHDIPPFATGDGNRPPDQHHELEHPAKCCGSGFAKSSPVRADPILANDNMMIPPSERIGFDRAADGNRFTVSESGIVVVPKSYCFDAHR